MAFLIGVNLHTLPRHHPTPTGHQTTLDPTWTIGMTTIKKNNKGYRQKPIALIVKYSSRNGHPAAIMQ